MPTHKIAITLPDVILERVDQWAAKFNQSRSHFIAEQIEKQLRELEDAEVTQLYNTAYQGDADLMANKALADDMAQLAPETDGENEW